jgi:hypothetical protein
MIFRLLSENQNNRNCYSTNCNNPDCSPDSNNNSSLPLANGKSKTYQTKHRNRCRHAHTNKKVVILCLCGIYMVVVTVKTILVLVSQLSNVVLLHNGYDRQIGSIGETSTSSISKITRTQYFLDRQSVTSKTIDTTKQNRFCAFRRYPIHRHYQLLSPMRPDFLASNDVKYIYGLWPKLLADSNKSSTGTSTVRNYYNPVKICVNQSEPKATQLGATKHTGITISTSTSATKEPLIWPFMDGSNPSILLLQRVQEHAPDVANMILQHLPTTYYIVSICMKKDAQCTWNDNTTDPFIYDLPNLHQKRSDTIQTIIQFLDFNFNKLTEMTVYLERDAVWSEKLPRVDNPQSIEYYYVPALDDARLFVFQSQLYVSFREGPHFGHSLQILNPIHLDMRTISTTSTKTTSKTATIKASESSSFCCGRNMALIPDFGRMEQNVNLYILTWVDPVTVELVDLTPIQQKKNLQANERQLFLSGAVNVTVSSDSANNHVITKSNIHGTNAFMVPIPSLSFATNVNASKHIIAEYLGVAHFHRRRSSKRDVYARFGHHYTHAFYTISARNITGHISFHLTALSPEFVLPSIHQPDDADIIQFISGLEYDTKTNEVILSYGINDCEGAIKIISLSTVQQLLRPVPVGAQVFDFMLPLQ